MNQKTIMVIMVTIVVILAGTIGYLVITKSTMQTQTVAPPSSKLKTKPIAPQQKPDVSDSNVLESLSYCGKTIKSEKIMLDGIDLVNRIFELETKRGSDFCTNFDQISTIGVIQTSEGKTKRIFLFEKSSLSESDKKRPIEEQIQKIWTTPNVNEYQVEGEAIYAVSQFDGSNQPLGSLANTTLDKKALETAVSAVVNTKTNGAWDKKLEISTINESQKAAKGFWWAKDRWDWIAWQNNDGTWSVLVSADGFKCTELNTIPAQYADFFKSVTYQNGKQFCN